MKRSQLYTACIADKPLVEFMIFRRGIGVTNNRRAVTAAARRNGGYICLARANNLSGDPFPSDRDKIQTREAWRILLIAGIERRTSELTRPREFDQIPLGKHFWDQRRGAYIFRKPQSATKTLSLRAGKETCSPLPRPLFGEPKSSKRFHSKTPLSKHEKLICPL